MHYPPPHLETERLNMRPLVAEDAKIWQEFMDNDEAMRFLHTFFPADMQYKALQWIGFILNRYFEGRYGMLALIDKQTGELVGQCGLLAQVVDDIPELEVGYHILPQYWGKGYAPEAAKFFINYAFENNLTDSIISVIDVGNVKSQRVAEKNGLFRDKQTVQLGDDVYIYRILKNK